MPLALQEAADSNSVWGPFFPEPRDAQPQVAFLYQPPEKPQFAPLPAGEVPRSCLDISAARERLGWEPEVELLEGLRLTLEAPATA